MCARGPGPIAPTPEVASGAGGALAGLLMVVGKGVFATHVLGDRPLTIGRATECDVCIDHPVMSRQHAVLRPGPPRTIQDLGSTNGTQVAGVRHVGGAPVELRGCDGFHIGAFSFVLVAASGGADEASRSVPDAMRVVDPAAAAVSSLVRDLAASAHNVVILGETGVGKEVLAETLHTLSGRRGPLTRINCAALNASLLESELFGHEPGAFTGATSRKAGLLEASAGGTVFLDEVGELPASLQAKLLRAIEHREVLRLGATRPVAVDVRFLAATNRDLPAEVTAGRFRRDLFFRLDGVTLVVPPLRERRHLIAPLALGFLEEARRRAGAGPGFDPGVLGALEAYGWPGNVRELRAVIERAVLLAGDGELGLRHLTFARAVVSPVAVPVVTPAAGDPSLAGLDAGQRAERARIIAVLDAHAGSQTRAARELGIPRTTLAGKLVLLRIPRPRT